MTRALFCLALCVSASLAAPALQAGELIRKACVKTQDRYGSLNVRSAGNLSAPVVSRIRNGQCGITVVGYCGKAEDAGNWCTIQFGQIRFGVVHAAYLAIKRP